MGKPLLKTTKTKADTSEAIIIVGIVRNIASTIDKDIQRLTSAFSHFENIDWYLVESGSTDSSKDALGKLSASNPNFNFTQLELEKNLSRTENMALARNAYLEYLRKDRLFKNYRFVVVADFNSLNDRISSAAVQSCFEKSTWDVVTANQSGKYYDSWALRHPLWSPNDCWEQHEFFRKYTKFPERAITYSLRSRMIKIPRNSEWIKVDSAFGGLAIYKAELFGSAAKYVGKTDSGRKICEHVPFHSTLVAHGAQIFINPRLINTRLTDHTRRLSVIFTVLRICRYTFKLNLLIGRR
jgi:glycosyltransferase involved in cell wall biosynthesis